MTMDTKERIVDAAIQAFVQFGASKTSMAGIGDAASVSRQTLYDIFGNKDELIFASIQKVAAENIDLGYQYTKATVRFQLNPQSKAAIKRSADRDSQATLDCL